MHAALPGRRDYFCGAAVVSTTGFTAEAVLRNTRTKNPSGAARQRLLMASSTCDIDTYILYIERSR